MREGDPKDEVKGYGCGVWDISAEFGDSGDAFWG
jgi:hypothetical protein